MLSSVKNNGNFALISLLAFLNIALLMPLVHPVFHDHSEQHLHSEQDYHSKRCHHSSQCFYNEFQRKEHFKAENVKEDNHPCPICNVLTSSQILLTISALPIKSNGILTDPVSCVRGFQIKVSHSQQKPRAPPSSIPVPYVYC